MCFNQLRPGEKRDRMFIYQNSSNFIQRSLCLPFCAVSRGLADGKSDIPSDCITGPTSVRLLIVWRDRDDDDDCPTPGQIRALEKKLKRSPRWWVDCHYPGNWD
ncbi:hypothetical protein K503DRAFT_770305 [Rhizopogon vinicolor AM-OR11-026]|uniref:Uncharacterized protein n=1 Tax=Rhizopogon vinicolor AM-OR11-026 TaxID=1314800 RepID=A0A1B7N196_9AGAM|nr:hypothetical protein K503DRAFT_770305 [Rhizopogon vinicolor AM-OR11-026]